MYDLILFRNIRIRIILWTYFRRYLKNINFTLESHYGIQNLQLNSLKKICLLVYDDKRSLEIIKKLYLDLHFEI